MIGRDRELGSPHRHLGTRRRRGEEPLRHRRSARRASASRGSRSSSHSSWPHRARVSSAAARPRTALRAPYSAFAQQVKQIARIFDSDDAAEARARSSPMRSPRSPGLRPPRSTRRISRRSSASTETARLADREQLFFSARVLVEVARDAQSRRCSCTRTSTGPTRACSTCSRRSPPACGTSRCSSSRSRDRSFSASGRAGAAGSPRTRRLPLEPLGEAAGRELATELLGRVDDDDASRSQVAETAEGNPLFIEELARCLGEQQATGLDELPTSIRAIIAARLDALPAAERAVLVDASVVGPGVLARRAVARSTTEPTCRRCSAHSRRATSSSARRCPGSRATSSSRFKHGLIHDVAYATLPRAGAHAPSTPRSRAISRRRPTSASRTRRSRTTGARRARTSAPSSTSSPPPTRPAAAGRSSARSALYREALELLARRRRSAARGHARSSRSRSRPCTTSATSEACGAS